MISKYNIFTANSLGLLFFLVLGSVSLSQVGETASSDVGIFDQNLLGRADNLPQQEGVQPLARGQVHEAFATPTQTVVEPGPVVPKEPPPPIEEMPPEEKPEGDDVVWIHGYWCWNEETQDFDWVSGVWRRKPQGMEWIHGSWAKVDGGWRWTCGHWQPIQQAEVEVYPAPPPVPHTIDPPCPGEDYTYIPGCWIYRECRFVWRPACWVRFHPGWVYVCPRWIWTPAGWIFCEGYLDFCWRQRGLCFAPVFIDIRYRTLRGWCYRPRFILHDHCLFGSLFVSRHGFYCFGDYYHESYLRRGYVSWCDFRVNRRHCEPLFLHCKYDNRHNPHWEKNLAALQTARFRGEAPRPPRTFDLQLSLAKANTLSSDQKKNLLLLAPVSHVNTKAVQITRLDSAKVLEQQKLAGQRLDLGRQRVELLHQVQTASNTPLKVGEAPKALRLNLPEPAQITPPARTTPPLPANVSIRPQTTLEPKQVFTLDPKVITPRVEPKVEPRITPPPQPRVEPKPEPRITPPPQPRVEPKPEPRITPPPQPRVEPKPEPRITPPPQPRVEPKVDRGSRRRRSRVSSRRWNRGSRRRRSRASSRSPNRGLRRRRSRASSRSPNRGLRRRRSRVSSRSWNRGSRRRRSRASSRRWNRGSRRRRSRVSSRRWNRGSRRRRSRASSRSPNRGSRRRRSRASSRSPNRGLRRRRSRVSSRRWNRGSRRRRSRASSRRWNRGSRRRRSRASSRRWNRGSRRRRSRVSSRRWNRGSRRRRSRAQQCQRTPAPRRRRDQLPAARIPAQAQVRTRREEARKEIGRSRFVKPLAWGFIFKRKARQPEAPAKGLGQPAPALPVDAPRRQLRDQQRNSEM